jgi:hypothetical protein
VTRRSHHQVDGQGSYVLSPTKFFENESENDDGEKRRQVVTRDSAEESDSLYRP